MNFKIGDIVVFSDFHLNNEVWWAFPYSGLFKVSGFGLLDDVVTITTVEEHPVAFGFYDDEEDGKISYKLDAQRFRYPSLIDLAKHRIQNET